jgi:hypothetical protein
MMEAAAFFLFPPRGVRYDASQHPTGKPVSQSVRLQHCRDQGGWIPNEAIAGEGGAPRTRIGTTCSTVLAVRMASQ